MWSPVSLIEVNSDWLILFIWFKKALNHDNLNESDAIYRQLVVQHLVALELNFKFANDCKSELIEVDSSWN